MPSYLDSIMLSFELAPSTTALNLLQVLFVPNSTLHIHLKLVAAASFTLTKFDT
jgi:hypothetical protein